MLTCMQIRINQHIIKPAAISVTAVRARHQVTGVVSFYVAAMYGIPGTLAICITVWKDRLL